MRVQKRFSSRGFSALCVPVMFIILASGTLSWAGGEKWTRGADMPSAVSGGAPLVFAGKMWILGGEGNGTTNSVRSTPDGMTWATSQTLGSGALWAPRDGHTALAFDGKMWLIGGYSQGLRNDVYCSTSGANWTTVTTNAAWSRRYDHASVVFQNKMWVIGGDPYLHAAGWSYLRDVYSSSDGSQWTTVTVSPAWTPRAGMGAVVFNNRIFLLGGSVNQDSGTTETNEVWSSADGAEWTRQPDAPWHARTGFSALVHDGRIWVIGGAWGPASAWGYGGIFNDVWYSTDGSAWKMATSNAGWLPRHYHASAVFQDKIWVVGGTNGSDYIIDYRDVWSSDFTAAASYWLAY